MNFLGKKGKGKGHGHGGHHGHGSELESSNKNKEELVPLTYRDNNNDIQIDSQNVVGDIELSSSAAKPVHTLTVGGSKR